MSQKQYFAQVRVKHSVSGRFYERGEQVPVDHLEPDDLALLVENAILREVEIPEPAVQPEPPAVPETPSRRSRQNPPESEVTSDD
ncbi:MAG: hypothetical protein L0219_07370 [Phycisphaerales bacterium]|nr:hypothetical protein [Phycisphaerales bacterium]